MNTCDKQNLFFRDTKKHFEILDGLRGVAFASLKLYDMPLRKWLTKKYTK